MSAGARRLPHGGIMFLPRVTELTKRSCWSCGNLVRSKALSGFCMRVPWHGEQLREKIDAPLAICSGGKVGSWAAPGDGIRKSAPAGAPAAGDRLDFMGGICKGNSNDGLEAVGPALRPAR